MTVRRIALRIAVLVGSALAGLGLTALLLDAQPIPRPDPRLTPGAVLTRDTARICRTGYAFTVLGTTYRQRDSVFRRYGLSPRLPRYQADHLLPRSLGGATVLENLWPQPYGPMGAAQKDTIDRYSRALVCQWHRLTIDSAQALMSQPLGWVVLYKRYHHMPLALRRTIRPEREP